MSEFRTVCRVGDVKEGEGRTVEVDQKLIAVFLHQGQYFAIDDVCPHMGASLAGGYVENGTVTCPWHAWRTVPGRITRRSRLAALRCAWSARRSRCKGCSQANSPRVVAFFGVANHATQGHYWRDPVGSAGAALECAAGGAIATAAEGDAQARTGRVDEIADGGSGAHQSPWPGAIADEEAGRCADVDLCARPGALDCGDRQPADAAAAQGARPGRVVRG